MNANFTSAILQVEKHTGTDIIRSVRSFFGLRIFGHSNKSRIVRRPTKTYEEFIFKGYERDATVVTKAAAFKRLRFIWKN